MWAEPRFAILTWYERYIPIRQVAGTRTARYRAVPPKIDRRRSISTVGDRLREKSTVDDRLSEKKGKRRRGKEEKKKRGKKKEYPAPARRPRPHAVLARTPSSLARRRRQRVAGAFSPAQGERSRRPVCTVHTAWYRYQDELGTPVSQTLD
ncbi:hypothetical protein BHM03_00011955 [Ensete ventricosum]|nr:hypothetical protein BHM03_00011955 [Ensete ventricosum]